MGEESWADSAYVVPIVFCFLIRNGKVLLIRRAYNPYKGETTIPGGRKKKGESLREGIRREILEETGYQLGEIAFSGILHAHREGDSKEYISHYFVCRDFAGEQRASDEGELLWVEIDRSRELPGIHPFYLYLLPYVLSNQFFETFVRIDSQNVCQYNPPYQD